MKRIIRNLWIDWRNLGILLLIILVQMYCAVKTADTVYEMRSTGAGDSGIEYAVAQKLTSDGFQRVRLYMSDSERMEWENCYEKTEDGFYCLSESCKLQNRLEELDGRFLIPQAVAQKLSQMSKGEVEAFLKERAEKSGITGSGEDGALKTTDYLEVRDLMEHEFGQDEEKEIRSLAISFVRKQSDVTGVDLEKIQTRYLSGSVFWIILNLLLIAGTAVGAFLLCGTQEQLIGRRIREAEVCQAEKLLFYVLYLLCGAILLSGIAFSRLMQTDAAPGWYAAGLIVLAAALIAVWLICTRAELKNVYEKLAVTKKGRWAIMNKLRIFAAAGVPAAAFIAGLTSVFSRAFGNLLFLILADILAAAAFFLFRELLPMADCVEESFAEADDIDDWGRL
ncbi:MAG: hypothetical protein Q4F21_01075 [Lachnospiraceae bacterium]|nr:hypothetical protein [Lachnospiraceae bacterium]